jgi:4-amino-4-deoxy-L-arabinose transferase-like glycosyltransferase/membrane-associated phospholipid phosphatase
LAAAAWLFHSSPVPWLQNLDVSLFRAINKGLSNDVLDWLMPIFAWNAYFVPAVIVIAIALLWKGGPRGRLFVFLLALILAMGDAFVINMIKHSVGRLRPFHDIPDAILLVGRGHSGSMPSSHTATWFAGTLIAYAFYRRTIYVMLPLAIVMAFSRVYVGVHYPSDVLAGATLGMGYAAAGLVLAQVLWRRCGPVLMPEWFQRTPVLLRAPTVSTPSGELKLSDRSYLRFGYAVIGCVLVARLIYLASGEIELSEDEAYQWLWSKNLALSYYSKPPMIAYTQFLGTSVWGDTEFGVRFFSPVIAATLSILVLRFFAANAATAAGFWLVLVLNCTPILAVGGTLLTVDPLLVLFWTAAMVAGWRAVQPDGRTAHWAWSGLWMGLGFLSKYTAALQIICFAIYFLMRREARMHLRRSGPYIALAIVALCTIPVIIWNAQHNWITVEHVASNAARSDAWRPTLKFFWEFLGAEFGLLNPFFFIGTIWAMLAFWRWPQRTALWDYAFCMGGPLFLGYMLFTFYKRVFPNWIAAAIVPLFCLMVLYWQQRIAAGWRLPKRALAAGLGLGAFAVVILHDTDLVQKIISRTLPAQVDPLRRVRSWSETAKIISAERDKFVAEGKPVFVITDHYGMAGQLSFYMPAAKAAVRQGQTFVYTKSAKEPRNQFYFWPGYRNGRSGENAIFVTELRPPRLASDWWWKWLRGQKELYVQSPATFADPPAELIAEFHSVTDLGAWDARYKGRVLRRVQLFACRNLR